MKKFMMIIAVAILLPLSSNTYALDSGTRDRLAIACVLGGCPALWNMAADMWHDATTVGPAERAEKTALLEKYGPRGAKRDQYLYDRETAGMGRVIDAQYDGEAYIAKKTRIAGGNAQAGQIRKWAKQGKVAMTNPYAQQYKQALIMTDTPNGPACYSSQLNRSTTNLALCDGI